MSANDLPDTPVGQSLTRLLRSLTAPGGLRAHQITDLFHPSFVQALGPPELVVDILGAWAEQFMPFSIQVDEERSTSTRIAAEVTNAKGVRALLTCTIEETDGHLITGLQTRPKPRDIASLEDVDDLLGHHNVAGLSVAAVVGGEIAWARAWGLADTSASSPMTAMTILQCGSISKAVTALAALRMVDEGILDLDRDVNEVLTSWKVPAAGGWQPVITLRDLLTHTAGLTIWGFRGYDSGSRIPSLVEVLDGKGNTPAIRPEAIPRLMWRYSGGGFSVLQQAIIDVSGKSFPDVLKDLVLNPLGMNDSTFEQPIPDAWVGQTASGHGGGKPVDGRWRLHPEMAAAGLWTTASDLARFLLGVVNSRSGRRDAVLSKRVASEMLTGHDVAPGMSLGVMLGGSGDVRAFGHGGTNLGFTGRVVSTSDGSFGLVALTNSNEGHAAVNDLFRFLAKDHGVPELLSENSMSSEVREAMMRAVPITHREPAAVSAEEVEARLGDYQTAQPQSIRVERDGHQISLQLEGQNPLPFYAQSPREWVSKAIDVRVEFEDGLLRLHQLGQTVEAKKVR